MNLYYKIFKPKKYITESGKEVVEYPGFTIPVIILLLLFTAISVRVTGFSLNTLVKNSHKLSAILVPMFKPNFSYFSSVVGPLLDTIKMSFLGSFLGAVVSVPFAFLASHNMVKSKIINWIVKLIFSVLRTIPTLVSALIATYVFGLGAFAGTVAIFIFSFSYVGKLTYEQIETVNMGAFEAMISMGFTRTMAFFKSIVPEILPFYLSTALYNFEGNVRYAAILGYVGAGGLGLLINENINWRDYNCVGMILLTLLVTVFVIENISAHFRRKLN